LARRRTLALEALAALPLVMREEGSRTRQLFEAALADAGLGAPKGVAPVGPIAIESREALREAVASGLGIGIVSAGEIGHDARLAAVPIAGSGVETREYVVCLKDRRNLRLIAAFLAEARRQVG
jgi:LysR family transcriptional regulator, low CO2-responsive transcriptional regulator